MKFVSHQHAAQLLHNKFVVVLGDSIQRGVYKDIVLLLQKEKFLTNKQLKTKGEMSFEQDCLVEGGSFKPMNNGTGYREVRQYRSDHHLVRFYFLTQIYSSYLQSVLNDFRNGLKPDVVIVNSCVWDISRYNSDWKNDYKENLQRFFQELMEVLPKDTLTIWNLTMPLGQNIRGGFLVPEIEHKVPELRHDVIQANFLSWTLANSFGADVLDLHYHFRHSLQHRTNDGIHWNALAHRCMTSLLLLHAAQAWGVVMPPPMSTGESGCSRELKKDYLTSEYLSFEENVPPPLRCKSGNEKRPPPKHHSRWNHGPASKRNDWFTDFTCCPVDHYDHDDRWDPHHHYRKQHVMRNRQRKTHYAPYY